MRKVFSRILVASASLGDDTVNTSAPRTMLYIVFAISVHSGVQPPTTFGVLWVLYLALPGSTRSGLKARWKSLPTLRPPRSSMGLTTSSVVPGYVVDSRTTSMSLCIRFEISLAELIIYERSGCLNLSSGVGTQMVTTSHSAMRSKSEAAERRPDDTSSLSSCGTMSPM